VGIKWIAGQDDTAPDYAEPTKIAIGATTLVLVLLFNRFLKGFWNRIALLIGLLVGTLIAWPLGLVDTTTFSQAPVFNLPTPFELGTPTF
ncbi:solute carrier family 23 protein, partial [Klebsiella pneumoniae]|uniref:solute carrier family 23 protein n=1 Tax=Klebsiella pneumoniae TaxID=573 RepID=UPI003F526141